LEAKIAGEVKYVSENMINIEIKHYAYTQARMGVKDSVLLLIPTQVKQLFKDQNPFRALTEKKFM
jgi:hypothetical protein